MDEGQCDSEQVLQRARANYVQEEVQAPEDNKCRSGPLITLLLAALESLETATAEVRKAAGVACSISSARHAQDWEMLKMRCHGTLRTGFQLLIVAPVVKSKPEAAESSSLCCDGQPEYALLLDMLSGFLVVYTLGILVTMPHHITLHYIVLY